MQYRTRNLLNIRHQKMSCLRLWSLKLPSSLCKVEHFRKREFQVRPDMSQVLMEQEIPKHIVFFVFFVLDI